MMIVFIFITYQMSGSIPLRSAYLKLVGMLNVLIEVPPQERIEFSACLPPREECNAEIKNENN